MNTLNEKKNVRHGQSTNTQKTEQNNTSAQTSARHKVISPEV